MVEAFNLFVGGVNTKMINVQCGHHTASSTVTLLTVLIFMTGICHHKIDFD